MTRRWSALLHAIAGFLRGFTGCTPLPRDPAAVRHALEHRATTRRGCC